MRSTKHPTSQSGVGKIFVNVKHDRIIESTSSQPSKLNISHGIICSAVQKARLKKNGLFERRKTHEFG